MEKPEPRAYRLFFEGSWVATVPAELLEQTVASYERTYGAGMITWEPLEEESDD